MLSLKLKLSNCHLGEDIVFDSAMNRLHEHWGITMDVSHALIFVGERKYVLTLEGRIFPKYISRAFQSRYREY